MNRKTNFTNDSLEVIKLYFISKQTLLYIKAPQYELGFLIEKSKSNYCYSKMSQKLSNKTTSSKAYWSILKTSLNVKKRFRALWKMCEWLLLKKKKQQMNYRFNIKNGVTENPLNYLPEKCNKKHSNKSVQSFYKIAILKNFAKLTRKHLCWNLFFNEFSGLQPATLFN